MISIEELRKLCNDETIIMTSHILDMLRERNIRYGDIKDTIMLGEIIEQYPADYPFPSCLILGIIKNSGLHVVAGIGEERIWIITAYRPSSDKWEDDLKTRKAVK